MDTAQSPKVSVIIPSYNEEKFLPNCIASVKRQITDFSFEIIVVDNASTDKTSEIAQNLGVRLIKQPKKGLCYARQAGLDAAAGEYLVYMDADARLPQGWLQKAIDYLESHPQVVGISCKHYFYDGRTVDNINLSFFWHVIAPLVNGILRLFGKPDVFIGLAVAIKTKALKDAGGINQNLIFFGEDAGIAHTLSTQGDIRFINNLYATASARRYKKKGLFKTLLLYWITFVFIQFGREKEAEEISQKYSAIA